MPCDLLGVPSSFKAAWAELSGQTWSLKVGPRGQKVCPYIGREKHINEECTINSCSLLVEFKNLARLHL